MGHKKIADAKKDFGSEKSLGQKNNVGSEKYLGFDKKCCSKKILGPKFCLGLSLKFVYTLKGIYISYIQRILMIFILLCNLTEIQSSYLLYLVFKEKEMKKDFF